MSLKHLYMDLLCCLIPIAGWVALLVFNVPLKTLFIIGLVLFCLLTHFWLKKKWNMYTARLRTRSDL